MAALKKVYFVGQAQVMQVHYLTISQQSHCSKMKTETEWTLKNLIFCGVYVLQYDWVLAVINAINHAISALCVVL